VLDTDTRGFVVKLLEQREELQTGAVEYRFNGMTESGKRTRINVPLSPRAAHGLWGLVCHLLACVLQNRLEATAGLFGVLESYHQAYSDLVRRNGRMTFADVQYILSGEASEAGDGLCLTREAGPEPDRLYVDYRLDGAYDHWALDEFQDTSRGQWQVIQNLVDEVLQDPEGRRSFFAVGDVKQAIYGWRGGDSSLLDEVRERYSLPQTPLDLSYRSCGAVIATVNRLFGQITDFEALPERVRTRWESVWRDHHTAREPVGGGYCRLTVDESLARNTPEELGSFAGVREWLLEARPWERGLEVAVLVRSNANGREAARSLRLAGIPAAWQGDTAIADNPVVATLLSLFVYAQHPGHSLAAGQVLMSPPFTAWLRETGQGADELAVDVAASIGHRGFARTLEHWIGVLRKQVRFSPFEEARLRQFLVAGEAFDASGNRDAIDFDRFVRSYTVMDVPAKGTVLVTTMHRSKGLGFDAVLVPLKSGSSGLTTPRSEQVSVACGPDSVPRWVLQMPPKDLAVLDPVLAGHMEQEMERSCFEELCLLYVALTRAKQGLYVFVPPPPKKRGSVHVHTLVTELLGDDTGSGVGHGGVLYEAGDPGWIRSHDRPQPLSDAAPASVEEHRPFPLDGLHRYRRRLPSRESVTSTPAATCFSTIARRGRLFGTAMHELFSHLSTLDPESVDRAVLDWQAGAGVDRELADAVVHGFRRCLDSAQVREALGTPGPRTEIWQERGFEILLDEEWVSGTFDRVVVERDGAGRVCGARILDFKTDRCVELEAGNGIADLARRHRSQLSLYRTVLSRLLDLPEASVRTQLIFTHPGLVVDVG
jgi:ATP-dependent helicase/nuclease subunit A